MKPEYPRDLTTTFLPNDVDNVDVPSNEEGRNPKRGLTEGERLLRDQIRISQSVAHCLVGGEECVPTLNHPNKPTKSKKNYKTENPQKKNKIQNPQKKNKIQNPQKNSKIIKHKTKSDENTVHSSNIFDIVNTSTSTEVNTDLTTPFVTVNKIPTDKLIENNKKKYQNTKTSKKN